MHGRCHAKYKDTIVCVFDDRFPKEGSRYIFDSSCSKLSVPKLPISYSVVAGILAMLFKFTAFGHMLLL